MNEEPTGRKGDFALAAPIPPDDTTLRAESVERDRAEHELQFQNAPLRRLLENIPEVIWRADEEGNALFISNRILKVFGFSSDEILGEGADLWFGRMHPDDRAKVRREYRALFRTGRAFDVEYRIQHRDGHWMWWHDRAVRVDELGGKSYADGLLSDVTEKRALEEQLRQSQKMEAVGQLAGGIAHDFNNLLMTISSFTELMDAAGTVNEKQQRYIREILAATKRAAGLTQQLLMFSCRQDLQPCVVDLNTLVESWKHTLPRLLGECIEIVCIQGEDLGRVKADPNHLEQVLLNLAVNARDAMPEGGRLTIETGNIALNAECAQNDTSMSFGKYVWISVTDTGMGMDSSTQVRIFEPFFTTKERGRGTGLGLSTVYNIVKQSGGFIRVNSEPGQGTCFQVFFPRIEDEPSAASAGTQQDRGRVGEARILLVEDEESLREAECEMLRSRGYIVLEARNGDEALQLMRTTDTDIDLLLTDVVMPGMSGPQLAAQVVAEYPGTRVIYMSGYSDWAFDSVPNAPLLRKPFTSASLHSLLRKVLDVCDSGHES